MHWESHPLVFLKEMSIGLEIMKNACLFPIHITVTWKMWLSTSWIEQQSVYLFWFFENDSSVVDYLLMGYSSMFTSSESIFQYISFFSRGNKKNVPSLLIWHYLLPFSHCQHTEFVYPKNVIFMTWQNYWILPSIAWTNILTVSQNRSHVIKSVTN